jgi:hypothetical protein
MVLPLGSAGLAAALALLSAGCGGGPKLVPVKGKVTLDNEPLKTGSLVLQPSSAKEPMSRPPFAEIKEDGSYEVFTDGHPGAPPGSYLVRITANAPQSSDPKDMYAPPKSLVDKRYNEVETSKLTLEVSDGAAPGAYDLKLKKTGP